MLMFATEIPVSREKTIADLLHVCKQWVSGSPHTTLSNNWEGMESSDDWAISTNDESVYVSKCIKDDLSVGGLRYIKRESGGLEWTTEVVGSKDSRGFWVSIRVFCESATPSIRLPLPRKPYIIRQLLESLGGGKDGEIEVTDKPLLLENIDIQFAGSLLLGKAGNRLPVVYVSVLPNKSPLIDAERLARWLSGMAHIVVEPNRAFSLRLMLEVRRQNVYGGAVGIYWPEGARRKAYFLGEQYQLSRDIEEAISEEIRVSLANRRSFPKCSWAYLRETLSKRAYQRLKDEGSTEISEYIEAFDAEIKAKDMQLQESEKEINRLEAALRYQDVKYANQEEGLVLTVGKERDFFAGEMRRIVLVALSDASRNVRANGRRKHILDDLLNANKEKGKSEAEKLEAEIKSLFKTYRDMDARCRNALLQLGFDVTEDGKHYKAVYQGDNRYTFSIPKTSSEHRAGKNLASDITNKLL